MLVKRGRHGMNSSIVTTRNELVLIALLALSQRLDPQTLLHDSLKNILTQESTRHSVLTYSQRYIDAANKLVQYKGTIFLHLKSFELDGCDLKIDVIVQDSYVGSEQKRRSGEDANRKDLGHGTDTYHYTYHLNLKTAEVSQVDTVTARPVQLRKNTRFVCEEERSCDLQWLRITTKTPSIAETRIMNVDQDFNQMVDQIAVPMTSREVALQSAKSLQDMVAACR
jgi:trehalose/maltose hydrolase-like predicted phosphorylase